jgi:oligoendopeptidase F
VERWLSDWSRLARLIAETFNRLYIRTTTHTADEEGHSRYRRFSEHIMPEARAFEQSMKLKLLASGLEPTAFEVPLARMKNDVELFRSENLALHTECERLESEYSALTGARSVDWDGQSLSQALVLAKLADADRATRERAWRGLCGCLHDQRVATDDIWVRFLRTRLQMARNAGYDDYRSYRWRELARFHYNPDDCLNFHAAIEESVVPVARRLSEERRRGLGVESLKPWDDHWFVKPDPRGRPPLRPFEKVERLVEGVHEVCSAVHPVFGQYFRILRDEGLLDLDSRGGKAQGAYMLELPASGRAFIFDSVTGSAVDLRALLHECGHAFHMFEATGWPSHYQSMLDYVPMEFGECASMSMELLGSPYLGPEYAAFYSHAESARAQRDYLVEVVHFLPYMAAVDAFQHWVYEHPEAAEDTGLCDAKWAELHRRFMPQLDWTGAEDTLLVSWRLQDHILLYPFYYVEYGVAQLGALQVWANSLDDREKAVADYRRALSLGSTVSLPDLYGAAGITFDFGRDTVARAMDLLVRTIEELAD